MSDVSSVQVALRIRPLVQSEINRGCKNALEVFNDLQQVRISDKCFTFNYLFDKDSTQADFYEESVQSLIPNLFKGYNLTILAYGQTGSGKTHSMGTAYSGHGEMGIIPRAVTDIFKFINDNFSYDFNVTVSFVELYQEVPYDLLARKPRDQCVVEIREDLNKGVFIPGLTEIPVKTVQETFECLQLGSAGRATSSTNMNAQSSRSHAIFTIIISMSKKGSPGECKTAKFHLVDLAGSERPKKTGATGQTFKEGVNINKGLFVLGNVISALGDEKGAPTYVNFRESNLTRLMKDSLGGNSITMMVACVSCADYNVEETLSTLRYADRAKRIRNKPIVNEDPKAAEINKLHRTIQQLKLEIMSQGGTAITGDEVTTLKKEISDLKSKLHSSVSHYSALLERVLMMQTANETMAIKFQDLQSEYTETLPKLNASIEVKDLDGVKLHIEKLKSMEMHFKAIDNDQKVNEAEIKNHERTVAKTADVASVSEEEIDKQQESHTAKQIAINAQIQQVTKILAQKEDLARQIASNANYMVDLGEMAENQSKIDKLEKEKTELTQQLKQVHTQGVGNKLAEQRRKRVQELESQLHDLKRKVTEQAKLIKLKEKDEVKIKKLNGEIVSMKSEKVKLIKSMRHESEEFRKWKQNRERELSKLQSQDRKRQNEMANMRRQHTLQETVWKRKLEQAAANAKRLKDALSLRKNVQDTKFKGKVERFGPWLQQEVNIHANLVVAKASCESLMEDRGALKSQLDHLNENKDENVEEIRRVEEEIDMRSVQIRELQQKIIESDDDDRSRTRFDSVQTMADAKYALKILFDLTTEFKRAELEKANDLESTQAAKTELQHRIGELEDKIKQMEDSQVSTLNEMENDYEEKTLLLLQQLRGVQIQGIDEQTQHRISIQEQLNNKLQASLDNLQNEKDDLLKCIDSLKSRLATNPQIIIQDEDLPPTEPIFATPPPAEPPKKKKRSDLNVNKENKPKASTSAENVARSTLDDSLNNSYEDDTDKDPDWRKTPLAKQMRALRATTGRQDAFKRSIGGGCNCRTNCMHLRCPCKKTNKECGPECKCKSSVCVNRGGDQVNGDEDHEDVKANQEFTEINGLEAEPEQRETSYKKPRLTSAALFKEKK